MNHLFVPYSIALLAKEKGFDEPCIAYYAFDTKEIILCKGKSFIQKDRIDVLAPLYQQILDFLREKHQLYISIETYNYTNKPRGNVYYKSVIDYILKHKDSKYDYWKNIKNDNSAYYQCLCEAIKKALNLIKITP